MFYGMTRFVSLLFAAALTLVLATQSARAQIEFGIPTVPQASPDTFNVEGGYGYPWFSPDGLSMYFASDRPGPNSGEDYSQGQFDLWTAERASVNDQWGPFTNLGDPVNTSEKAEFAQSLTADGQELYFMRALSPFGLPEGDLFFAKRQVDGTWGTPEPLAGLNTADREGYPTISPDGLTLYFNVHLNEIYSNPTGLTFNTFVAHRKSRAESFTDPEFFFGGYGTVTPDGLTHIMLGYPDFAEHYGVPHIGDGDLYIRTRESVDDDFGPVQHLPAPVNSSGQLLPPPLTGVGLECCAMFTPSGDSLYFTSVRPGTDPAGPVGFVDLWQAHVAQAVPVVVKPGDETPIDWYSAMDLQVAILSTGDFDARSVNEATLVFGDPILIGDGATPVSPLSSENADVNGDGLTDLMLMFDVEAMQTNGVIGLASTQGYVTGQLLDGTVIAGRDGISLIPEPSSLLLLAFGLSALALCKK